MPDLVYGILASLAYGAVGIALMALGFALVDLATPGKLRELIWAQGNQNASLLLGAGLLGVGIIVTTAILVSHSALGMGLLSTVVYGLIGLLLNSLAFVLLDFATPGRLGAILSQERPHPAAWVSAALQISISAIIAAAIS